jgi:hypothetical protein
VLFKKTFIRVVQDELNHCHSLLKSAEEQLKDVRTKRDQADDPGLKSLWDDLVIANEGVVQNIKKLILKHTQKLKDLGAV